jgi:hypothetical protein
MTSLKLFIAIILVLLLGACNIPQPKQTDIIPQANYWQQLGTVLDINFTGAAQNSSLALDNSGYPVVSWYEHDGTSNSIYVKRWNGSNWVRLGGALDFDLVEDARTPSLSLDSSGTPVVSWSEHDGSTFNIYTRRWNGANWVLVGFILNNSVNVDGFNPSLALDISGNPVVSWEEYDGSTISSKIYVKRFNGLEWVPLGGSLNAYNQNAYNPSLALDSLGNPVVAWEECFTASCTDKDIIVKRWNGTNWVQLGTYLDIVGERTTLNPSLALDSSGNPVVSWGEHDGTSTNIYVKRWNGSNWVQLGTVSLDANANKNAGNSSLALDSSGNPVVSWNEDDGTSTNIYVKRWTGSSWALVGSFLDVNTNKNALSPSLALDSLGNPVVNWHEHDGSSNNIYVKKYITNSWQDMGGSLDVAGGQSAINTSIARKSNNNPVVAWDETDSTNGSRNVYVREWTGSGWSLLGRFVDKVLSDDVENPSVAIRSDNRPIVAFQENGNIFVRRWTGSVWTNVSNTSANYNTGNAATPSLAFDSSIDAFSYVAFSQGGIIKVSRAQGGDSSSTWVYVGGTTFDLNNNPANEGFRPSIALKIPLTANDPSIPVVAWYEDNGTSFDIFVKEFNSATLNWVALGGAIDKTVSRDAKDVVLAIGSDNRPVVAWEEAGNIYVKRWNGTSWVSLGGALDKIASNEALRPSIDLRSDNNPVVTWQEWNGSSYDVWVKRWTGSTWTTVSTNALDKSLGKNAERPALVLKTDNNPIVSWDEDDGVSENVFVRRF